MASEQAEPMTAERADEEWSRRCVGVTWTNAARGFVGEVITALERTEGERDAARAQLAQAQAERDEYRRKMSETAQTALDLLAENENGRRWLDACGVVLAAAEQARERAEAALRSACCGHGKLLADPCGPTCVWNKERALAAPGKESEAKCKHGRVPSNCARCVIAKSSAPPPSPAAEALTAYVPPPHTQTPEYQRDVREHFGPAAEAQGACSACGGSGVEGPDDLGCHVCAGTGDHRPTPAASALVVCDHCPQHPHPLNDDGTRCVNPRPAPTAKEERQDG